MTNLEKYNSIFIESFGVDLGALNGELVYQSITEWDSVGHMALIAAIEEQFDIFIDIDDIIEFGSYTIGMDILKKYEVQM